MSLPDRPVVIQFVVQQAVCAVVAATLFGVGYFKPLIGHVSATDTDALDLVRGLAPPAVLVVAGVLLLTPSKRNQRVGTGMAISVLAFGSVEVIYNVGLLRLSRDGSHEPASGFWLSGWPS